MAVISISGQFGAGEDLIADRVAKTLAYRLVNRPVVLRVLEQYGIIDYEKLLDTPPHLFDGLGGEKQSANDLLNSLYLLFAKRNNVVISSRRAFISLEPFLNVLTVFLKAPESERIRNVMHWQGLSHKEARRLVRTEEERRRGILESLVKGCADSMAMWTIILDTHRLGMDVATNTIVAATRQVAKADNLYGWHDGIPTTETIETDHVMENVVDKVLA